MSTRGDFDPIHPGEILVEEFLKPLGMSPYALAKAIEVPRARVGASLDSLPSMVAAE